MNEEQIGNLISNYLKLGFISLDDLVPVIRKGVSKSLNESEEAIFNEHALHIGKEYPIGKHPGKNYNTPLQELGGKTLNEYDIENYKAFNSYKKQESL